MTPSNLVEQLTRDEGKRNLMYKDGRNIPTIGVGHNLRDRSISDAAVAQILLDDINDTVKDIQKWPSYKALDPIRQACLINMAFTMGTAGLAAFQKLLQYCSVKAYPQAAKEIRRSLWFTQAPDRAERVAKQMETGEWQ